MDCRAGARGQVRARAPGAPPELVLRRMAVVVSYRVQVERWEPSLSRPCTQTSGPPPRRPALEPVPARLMAKLKRSVSTRAAVALGSRGPNRSGADACAGCACPWRGAGKPPTLGMNARARAVAHARGMLKTSERRRRSRQEWVELVQACERSGLSRKTFAAREGLQERTFVWWASKLAPARAPQASAQGRFISVRVGGELAGEEAARTTTSIKSSTVEIVLANGRLVRCDLAQANDPRLANLVALAERAGRC
jgi:hypothetical protein